MSQFKEFASLINQRLNELSKGELYTVSVPDIYDRYLAALPKGWKPLHQG
jgi:hypothetical protein